MRSFPHLTNKFLPARIHPGKPALLLCAFALVALYLASFPSQAAGISPLPAATVNPQAAQQALFLPLIQSGSSGAVPASTTCIPAQTVGDALFASQANMRQIHADQAWANCLQGSPEMVVAVVDSGVDLTHPDLVANLLPGANFVEPNSPPGDDTGHGTHVAGIIAASLDGQGVVGVAPQVKILPVRVMQSGAGTTSAIAQGISWAADRAQIINLSLGGPSPSQTLQRAIDYAIQTKGRLVFAAAGNEGDRGNPTEYPAAFPGVMAVGAVDGSGQHAAFSNTGSYLAFSAPGVGITSTVTGGGYAVLSGTSMATPHVSGLAGLIWSAHPTYTASQVLAMMKATAVDLGDPGPDPVYGYGLIDAFPAGSLALDAPVSAASVVAPEPAQAVDDRSAPIAPGHVLVQFKPGQSTSTQVRLPTTIEKAGEIAALGVQIYQVPAGQEWAAVDALRARPDVEYAEPDYLAAPIQ